MVPGSSFCVRFWSINSGFLMQLLLGISHASCILHKRLPEIVSICLDKRSFWCMWMLFTEAFYFIPHHLHNHLMYYRSCSGVVIGAYLEWLRLAPNLCIWLLQLLWKCEAWWCLQAGTCGSYTRSSHAAVWLITWFFYCNEKKTLQS